MSELSIPSCPVESETFVKMTESPFVLYFLGWLTLLYGKLSADDGIALQKLSKKPSLTLWSSFLSSKTRLSSLCYCLKLYIVLYPFAHFQFLIQILFIFQKQALANNAQNSMLFILVENHFILVPMVSKFAPELNC